MATPAIVPVPRAVTAYPVSRRPLAVGSINHPAPGAAVAVLMPTRGFGFAVYAETSTAAPLSLDAGVRTQLVMAVDPTKTLDRLRPPFSSLPMWDGSLVRTASVNDVLALRIAMNAVAGVAGGNLKLEAQLAGSPVLLDTKVQLLCDQASTTERVFFDMLVYAGAAFVTGGVALYLTSSVPVAIQSETILIVPQSAGP